jgi:hypothetical protein
MEFQFGAINIIWGWVTICVGIFSGAIIGMWSFSGPFPNPPGFKNYDDLPRRMVRLAHIAFVMLPLINIVYGQFLDKAQLTDQMKLIGSYLMLIGMVGVPVFLILGALVWLPFKYVEAIPVTATLVGLMIMAYGYLPFL